jgi:SH3-like domain-containing protein
VKAYLTPKFPVDIKSCDGTWCEITAIDHSVPGHPANYSGFMRQADLWGVYKDEKID